jgi:colicin import membrane protein
MADRNPKGTPLAVVLSAILHLGIVVFLYLATLSCTSYDAFLSALHLPNPITCTPPPLQLKGPVIEATLIGNTAAPPPKAVKVKPVPNTTPPPPSTPPPQPPEVQPQVSQLPPPPKNPDTVDQERVVQEGLQKAEDAKKEQEEREKQRQADLDAKAAAKQKAIDDYNKFMAQVDNEDKRLAKLTNKADQAKQQLKDIQNAKDNGIPDLPNAAERQTGNNAQNSSLRDQYLAAIQNAVTQNWMRPDNMPNAPCVVHIVQSPGGMVMSAKASPNCPYDDAGKRSVENAVLRSQPLPYKGFETVFQREIDFTFIPQ